MPIFRPCFAPREKARTIFRALRISNFCYKAVFSSVVFEVWHVHFQTRKNATKTKKSRFFPLYLDSVLLKLLRCQFSGHVSHLGKKLEQFSALCFSYFKLLLHGRPFFSCFLSLACPFSNPKKCDENKKVSFLSALFGFSITYTSSMPIFRACFTPRKKARTIFRALLVVF